MNMNEILCKNFADENKVVTVWSILKNGSEYALAYFLKYLLPVCTIVADVFLYTSAENMHDGFNMLDEFHPLIAVIAMISFLALNGLFIIWMMIFVPEGLKQIKIAECKKE